MRIDDHCFHPLQPASAIRSLRAVTSGRDDLVASRALANQLRSLLASF